MNTRETAPAFLCRYLLKRYPRDAAYSQGTGDTIREARINAMTGWIERRGVACPAREEIYEDRGPVGVPSKLQPGEVKFGNHRYGHVRGIYKMTASKWAGLRRLRNEAASRIEVVDAAE